MQISSSGNDTGSSGAPPSALWVDRVRSDWSRNPDIRVDTRTRAERQTGGREHRPIVIDRTFEAEARAMAKAMQTGELPLANEPYYGRIKKLAEIHWIEKERLSPGPQWSAVRANVPLTKRSPS